MTFTELQLHHSLIEAISYMGFQNATPVQELAIPIILNNQDLIACAQTGTGKTGAFVLPILHKLIDTQTKFTDTLIIVPTRELAIQIEQQIEGLAYFISIGSKAVYGGGDGKDWISQKEALVNGTHIIVATPGKLLAHLQMGYVNFKHIKHLVLDEADRMLDMGFIDDINSIISHLPQKRQTLMFSATMPPEVERIAKRYLRHPVVVTIGDQDSGKNARITQRVLFLTSPGQKENTLNRKLSHQT